MPQITITFDVSTSEAIDVLPSLVDALLNTQEKLNASNRPVQGATAEKTTKPKAEKPIAAQSEPKQMELTPQSPAPSAEPKAEKPKADSEAANVTFTDIRAKALVFSKSGRQVELKKIFDKYGAKKLSDISEEQFPALMADLVAADG